MVGDSLARVDVSVDGVAMGDLVDVEGADMIVKQNVLHLSMCRVIGWWLRNLTYHSF